MTCLGMCTSEPQSLCSPMLRKLSAASPSGLPWEPGEAEPEWKTQPGEMRNRGRRAWAPPGPKDPPYQLSHQGCCSFFPKKRFPKPRLSTPRPPFGPGGLGGAYQTHWERQGHVWHADLLSWASALFESEAENPYQTGQPHSEGFARESEGLARESEFPALTPWKGSVL